jgi:hypothetical protein
VWKLLFVYFKMINLLAMPISLDNNNNAGRVFTFFFLLQCSEVNAVKKIAGGAGGVLQEIERD